MKKKRLGKEDWVDLAMRALADDGPDALKLDAICARAGLTKGSFYHHFEDHISFLKAVVAEWRQRQTDDVIQKSQGHDDPDEIADALLEQALKINFQLELGIRELGRKAPEIGKIVSEIDKVRTEFMTQIYARRFDLPPDQVRDEAFLEYSAFAGFMMLEPSMDEARQRHLAKAYDEMVTTFFGRGV